MYSICIRWRLFWYFYLFLFIVFYCNFTVYELNFIYRLCLLSVRCIFYLLVLSRWVLLFYKRFIYSLMAVFNIRSCIWNNFYYFERILCFSYNILLVMRGDWLPIVLIMIIFKLERGFDWMFAYLYSNRVTLTRRSNEFLLLTLIRL